MPYTTNDGVRLYWEEHGSGPPVLMIMGLSFTLEMWFRVLPFLRPRYRTILFDNRGMGRSDVPDGPYSIGQMARDATAVLDAAGVAAAHIVGASMGGMIAQEMGLRYPGRVLSLVLGCTTHSGLLGRWPHFNFLPRGVGWLRTTSIERERALRPLLYAKATPSSRIEEDYRVRCQCAWTPKGFWSQFAGILMWSSYRRLPKIKSPTLVVHGAEDHLVPSQNGRIVASRIPNARFHLVPDAGHILITDQPEAAAKLLLDFLDEQASVVAIEQERTN
jgi:pimeloyl-ACP methyl ester carboxylesterase